MSDWRSRAVPADTMGWRSRAQPVEAAKPAADAIEEPGGLTTGPGTTFGLNALDSLSVAGVPTVLGGLDAVRGIDSADLKSHGSLNPIENAKGILDRYYANKDFYSKGMERLGTANPKAEIAGQLAPIAVPGGALAKGAKLGSIVKAGAAIGTGYGALRGPAHTLAGDVDGTLLDAGTGGLAGAGLSLLGAGAGKLIEKGGNIARGGMAKVLNEVRERTATDIGKTSKKAGEAVGGIENLFNKQGMEDAAANAQVGLAKRRGPAAVPYRGNVPGADNVPLDIQENLLNRRQGNAEAVIQKFKDLRAKYGELLRPSTKDLNAKNLEGIRGEASGHIRGAVQSAALGYAGYKGAEAAGVDPRIGAAVGGAGGLYAARKFSQAVFSHPATLQKLMALRPIGQALARLGGKAASNPETVKAIVYALRDHPEVKAVLESPTR